MIFKDMLLAGGFAILVTLAILFLVLIKTGGEKAKLEKVPLKTPLILVTVLCLGAIGVQAMSTNLAAVNEVNTQRTYALVVQIESGVSLSPFGSAEELSPFSDISGGGNDWEDEDLRLAIGSGEKVQLKTVTGKPATVQLTALEGDSFIPELTYDGVKMETMAPATVKAKNTKGFPQFLSAPELPAAA